MTGPHPAAPSPIGFKLEGIAPTSDLAWILGGTAARSAFWAEAAAFGLPTRRRSLGRGLDKDGKPLAAIAESTRLARKRRGYSPQGRSHASAPPLTPCYGLSRTRCLLRATPLADGVWFDWGYDRHTRKNWGVILDYHRRGVHGKVRDVIGLPPGDLAAIRQRMDSWWAKARQGFLAGPQVAALAQPGAGAMGLQVLAHAGAGAVGVRVPAGLATKPKPKAKAKPPEDPAGIVYYKLPGTAHVLGMAAEPASPPDWDTGWYVKGFGPKATGKAPAGTPKPKPKPPKPKAPPTPPPARPHPPVVHPTVAPGSASRPGMRSRRSSCPRPRSRWGRPGSPGSPPALGSPGRPRRPRRSSPWPPRARPTRSRPTRRD